MVKRPFSINTYFASTRGRAPVWTPDAPRPKGELVWLHAGSRAEARALETLAARLRQQRPETGLLATGAWDEGAAALPPETPGDARLFLDHWRPDLCLWSGPTLNPALLWTAHEDGVPLLHADDGQAPHVAPAARWLPDPVPATLALFDTLFVADAAAERRLPRASLSADRIRRSGVLQETTLPLDCDDDQHEELLGLLAGRPIWLAARLRAGEARLVIDAHRVATRLSHRLVLVLVPASEEDGVQIAAAADASGLRVSRWDEGETVDDGTQIILCQGAEELGLWYRLAPLAFLGGSLVSGHGGTDPFEAASLGVAILYGPNVGRHLAAYTTLVDAGAARIVRDEDSLAGAVSQLLAPDRAASMAHAGWEVVSAGAEATDAVLARMVELLDARRGRT
ncbi:3-deoxy-D-manno-octulosonic-acid transferase [Roseivivax marinus]|uniref:3-deoxy-D-manno-octulosonic acid transferase n=1 Tax=Roseivivax marinus TaxID=1379903 RepID=UPI0008BA9CBD|nr:3-deoxy-D-manno-octulosonic-acid transferase [Roseivivax marinus]